MKYIFIIVAFIGFIYTSNAQRIGSNDGILLNKEYFVANQSNTRNGGDASLAVDNSYATNQFASVELSTNNWWQLNMKFIRKISGLKVFSSELSNYYIFVSKAPILYCNIEQLIQDPWISYINVTSAIPSGTFIPLGGYEGQYIMIVSVNASNMNIIEMDVYGDVSDGNPNDPVTGPPYLLPPYIIGPPLGPPYGTCGPWWWPPYPPYPPTNPLVPTIIDIPPFYIGPPFIWVGPNVGGGGTGGVGPWWSNSEICNDGIDNDDNGLTDCEDYPCGVGTFNVVKTDPTCPICNNGRLCIFAGTNVKKVSIDNGATWAFLPNTGQYCFDNLDEGTFVVKLQTQFGCEAEKSIVLAAPTGEAELCENGGFEKGTFENWTGGLGSYDVPFDNTNFDIGNRHTILANPFQDQFVPFIVGFGGSYCVKLGNTDAGAKSERLTYCLTIDNNNKNLSFNYAAVLETPLHDNDLPYFQYKIYDKLTTNIIDLKKTDTDDPFLTTVNSSIQALGWQCVEVDLSAFIGQEVCVEFISADCGASVHFGYGYIDGLCAEDAFVPDVKLIANSAFCKNQPIKVDVDGVGFNQFKWTISKMNPDGSEFDVFTGPVTLGFQAEIEDLKSFYESSSDYVLDCDQRIKIKFNAISDCGSSSEEKIVNYSCAEYNINYCDPLYYCISANQNQLQIQGENDCNSCTYKWSSPQGLAGMINTAFKFPTLDKSLAFNAFSKEWNVKVTSAEGCIYDDTFTASSNPFTINIENIEYGYCAYKVTGNITFDFPIENGIIIATARNISDNTSFPIVISGQGNVKNFEFTISRAFLSQIQIEVNLNYPSDCFTGNCTKSKLLEPVSGPSHSQWKAFWPSFLSPDGNGINDFWKIQFRSVMEDMTNCQDMNWINSSIYFYKLEIFDRLGNLMFVNTVDVSILSTTGILGDEIQWDGFFNGQPVNPGEYTWKATVNSCYDGSNQCNDCGGDNAWRKCADSGNMIFAGTVFVLL